MAFDGGRLTSARRRRRGAGLSQAAQFAKGKPEVISWAFDDPVSDMGSVWIADTVTPANNFNSSASAAILAKFTGWSATSPMTVRGRDGTLKYAPHNLFLNSDAPATQSITTVVGLKYKVFLTGSGSIALSGAGSGTVTDGSPVEITASTTSLTCTVSGSPTTAQVVNSPCHEGYVSAAGSAKFSIPTTYDTSGNKLGFLSWEARTNAAWWSRDLTQSAYLKTNATGYKTARGTDNELNSASRLVATAANGSVIQTITAASAQRVSSAKVRRSKGSGTVKMSQGETTGSELVTNGTFDTDASGWTSINATLSSVSGSLRITKSAVNGQARQTVTVVAGKLYKVTGSLTGRSVTDVAVRLRLGTSAGGSDYANAIIAEIGVTTGSATLYFIAASTSLYIGLYSAEGSGYEDWDNISVLECTETSLSLNAVSYAEVSGTELITSTSTPSGGWTESGGVITAPGTSGTDRVLFALSSPVVAGKLYKVTIPNTMPSNGFYVDFDSTGGGQIGGLSSADSVVYVVPSGSSSSIRIGRWAGTPTGTIGPISVKEVEPVQAWTEAETAAATITNPCVALWCATSGDAIDVDHVHCEVGTEAGPPIITAGAAVTRAQSALPVATSLFPFSATEGTVVAFARTDEAVSTSRTIFSLSDGTANERINSTASDSLHLYVVDGGVDQASLDAGTFVSGATGKLAIAFAANDFAACIDGGTVATDAAGTLPTPTALRIGTNHLSASPANNLNGTIARIKYIPERLSNADIQSETV